MHIFILQFRETNVINLFDIFLRFISVSNMRIHYINDELDNESGHAKN